jgi:hypothetical protein
VYHSKQSLTAIRLINSYILLYTRSHLLLFLKKYFFFSLFFSHFWFTNIHCQPCTHQRKVCRDCGPTSAGGVQNNLNLSQKTLKFMLIITSYFLKIEAKHNYIINLIPPLSNIKHKI